MGIIKKMDLFILKKFGLIFFGSFFITIFVFMMQFTWRYIEDLVGKGVTIDVLGELYWHMALTIVPMSLPLSILLASLISFGNMGEDLELLAMKAAGIPLLRIMRPIGIVSLAFAAICFHFQNKIAPEQQLKLRTLLISLKQTSPALEIPEGVFYNNIPGFSLLVQRKNVETGMLYKVMIYKFDEGFERAQILLADSGRLESTDDKQHLVIDLWNGTQYQALKESANSIAMGGVDEMTNSLVQPFMRQTFTHEKYILDFDMNFEKLDAESLRSMANAKNLTQLTNDIDSMEQDLTNTGNEFYAASQLRYFKRPNMDKSLEAIEKQRAKTIDFDSLTATLPTAKMHSAIELASVDARNFEGELEWKGAEIEDGEHFIRLHQIQWHQKFTLSLSCLFFFLIGAPLGSIIRKGGLGLPAVISTLIFIFYYILDTSGMKMARQGSWNMVYGMWVSTMVLMPLGIYITYKANKDSVVFNLDAYLKVIRRWLGLRDSRHLNIKEVVIDYPDYAWAVSEAIELRAVCQRYNAIKQLYRAPNYFRVFFRSQPDHRAEIISEKMENFVEHLSNARNTTIINYLNTLPMIYVKAHTSPFQRPAYNVICGIVFPIGICYWFRIWRFRLRLYRDIKKIDKTLEQLTPQLIALRDQ